MKEAKILQAEGTEKGSYKRKDTMGVTSLIADNDFHEILAKELGPRFREYRKKWDEAGKCKMVQDFPLQLDVYLNFTCNLKCVSCINQLPHDSREYRQWGNPNVQMPMKVFKRLIDEGIEHNLYALEMDNINEPLLRSDLPEAIKYARDAGLMDVMFNTNATLLDENMALRILDAEPTRIMFSLDAIKEETYKKIRIGADFQTVMKNIDRFLEIKEERGQTLPLTRVSFCVSKLNYKELAEFKEYWGKKVDFLSVQGFGNPFVGSQHYERLEKLLRTPKKDVESNAEYTCAMPFQRISLTNSGDVLSCCYWYGQQMHVGNIYKNSLYEIWNSEKMEQLRKTINGPWETKPLICKRCAVSWDRASLEQLTPYDPFYQNLKND